MLRQPSKMPSLRFLALLTGLVWLCQLGCGRRAAESASGGGDSNPPPAASFASPTASARAPATNAAGHAPIYTYEIVHTFPHERDAFTQGLVFLDGILIESTGLYQQSSLRKVELETGKVLQRVQVPAQYFAEGLAVLGGKAYQLTWQNGKGFVYDLQTLRLEREFYYTGEGWGLTSDGQSLILSDGTDQIRFLDPLTFDVQRTIRVSDHGRPVAFLNELEYVKGEIFANVWRTRFVVRIDPASGKVLDAIDFGGLLAPADFTATTDVLNGIAYDAKGDRLFVTGKCWPKLFEVRIKPRN